MKSLSKKISKLPLVASIFVAGGFWGVFELPPFPWLKSGSQSMGAIIDQVTAEHPGLLKKSPFAEHGVVIYDEDRVSPGPTLVQGWLPGGPQVRLLDPDGTELHRWNIDFFDIWPNPQHIFPPSQIPQSKNNFHTQGFWPLEDGSILINIGNLGTALLDVCSNPLWAVDRMTHHSITRTKDGKYWIPSNISLLDTPEEYFPRGKTLDDLVAFGDSRYNNSVLQIDQTGLVLKEFSILQAFQDAGMEYALFDSRRDRMWDPTHINDIEVVTDALAAKIDGVDAGDLLVSVRQMHMLIIMDQEDGGIKWHQQGPWTRQHDPDITPDGRIEVFNNRPKEIGPFVDSSQIMSFDPATGETEILHPQSEEDKFYTAIMGTHQRLENGNILITSSVAGQLLEVTPSGEVVWDYRLPFNENVQSLFEGGMRVPPDYFKVKSWNCSEGA